MDIDIMTVTEDYDDQRLWVECTWNLTAGTEVYINGYFDVDGKFDFYDSCPPHLWPEEYESYDSTMHIESIRMVEVMKRLFQECHVEFLKDLQIYQSGQRQYRLDMDYEASWY